MENNTEENTDHVYKEGEETSDGFSIESQLNKDDKNLPFGLYNPETEGRLTWICGYGPSNDIIATFSFDTPGSPTEKDVRMLKDLNEAIFAKDELVKNGWKKIIPPQISFTVSGKDGNKTPLNRKQKRYLDKKLTSIAKQTSKE
jgi:hypothetical protein